MVCVHRSAIPFHYTFADRRQLWQITGSSARWRVLVEVNQSPCRLVHTVTACSAAPVLITDTWETIYPMFCCKVVSSWLEFSEQKSQSWEFIIAITYKSLFIVALVKRGSLKKECQRRESLFMRQRTNMWKTDHKNWSIIAAVYKSGCFPVYFVWPRLDREVFYRLYTDGYL